MSALHLRSTDEPHCAKCGAPLGVMVFRDMLQPNSVGTIRWVNHETAWRNDPSNCVASLIDKLRGWTTDFDGTIMNPRESPRDGLHCDVLLEAAATLERLNAPLR